jgi:hypothetical protein
MIERLHLSTVIFVAAAIWGVLLLADGTAIAPAWFHPFSRVVGLIAVLLSIFDIWLWRWRILQGWFVKRPVIDGTWRAEIRSDWVNPETNLRIGPIPCFMVIRQTFSRLTLSLMTEESRSELLGAEITIGADGVYRVFGVYRNEPRHSVRFRSEMHFGGLELRVIGRPTRRLEGHYWTDRRTAGEIFLEERWSGHGEDFASAQAMFPTRST